MGNKKQQEQSDTSNLPTLKIKAAENIKNLLVASNGRYEEHNERGRGMEECWQNATKGICEVEWSAGNLEYTGERRPKWGEVR